MKLLKAFFSVRSSKWKVALACILLIASIFMSVSSRNDRMLQDEALNEIKQASSVTNAKLSEIEASVGAQQAILLDSLTQYNYGPLETEIESLSDDFGNLKTNLSQLRDSQDNEETKKITEEIIAEIIILDRKISALEGAVEDLRKQNTDIAGLISNNYIDVEALKVEVLQYIEANYNQLPPAAYDPENIEETQEILQKIEEEVIQEPQEEVIKEKTDNGIGQEKQAEKENS